MSEMNVQLTDSVVPDYTAESPADDGKPRKLAGDWSDDDATAVDEILDPYSPEPIEYDGVPPETNKVPATNRLNGAAIYVPVTSGVYRSVMVLPADPTRKHLYITASGVEPFMLCVGDEPFALTVPSSGGAIVSDTPSKYQGLASFYNPGGGAVTYTIDDYTGPVHIGICGEEALATASIAIAAVSE